MCGIAALFGREPALLGLLPAMTTAMRHRGPDDEGVALIGTDGVRCLGGPDTPPVSYGGTHDYKPESRWDGSVPSDVVAVLGHRRLSILDLSPAGHQPMCSPDGRYWITYNGEVYNYVELRAELEALGHAFRTGTDTEVILAAFAEWGPDCVRRFQGMWAFALVDRQTRRGYVVRDPFGIKPLFYAVGQGCLAIASELKALTLLPFVSNRADAASVHHYLWAGLCDHGAYTFYADIRQLEPATYAEFALDEPDKLTIRRYWEIDLSQKRDIGFEEAAAQLRELFVDSVRMHLRSDVPVGAALSGGIDSSAVVMAMRAAAGDGLNLHTFSMVPTEGVSEEVWMDLVAKEAATTVHKTRPTSDNLIGDLEDLIAIQEVPFGSTSIYAQLSVFRLARSAGISVMLDGQGADEMLAGYVPYVIERWRSLLRQGRLLKLVGLYQAASALPGQASYMRRQAIKLLLPPGMRQTLDRWRGLDGLPHWLNGAWVKGQDLRPWPQPDADEPDRLREMLRHTLTTTSLPPLLRYEDRNAMSVSIESRVPFLTSELVSFVLSLPEEHLLSDEATSKAVLRRALRGLVPDAILDRRDKVGFATPEQRWLTSQRDWVQATLGSETARRIPELHVDGMLDEWAALESGQVGFDWRFWRWLNLILWAERFGVTFG
jgi:asparagine synthase (glutamine-hydrolysing)